MAKMTGYRVVRKTDGKEMPIRADPHGNNVAFECFNCKRPIIATAVKSKGVSRGYCKKHDPAECGGKYSGGGKSCGSKYWIEIDEKNKIVTVSQA